MAKPMGDDRAADGAWFQRVSTPSSRPATRSKIEADPIRELLGEENLFSGPDIAKILRNQQAHHEERVEKLLKVFESRVLNGLACVLDSHLQQKQQIERSMQIHEARMMDITKRASFQSTSPSPWRNSLLQERDGSKTKPSNGPRAAAAVGDVPPAMQPEGARGLRESVTSVGPGVNDPRGGDAAAGDAAGGAIRLCNSESVPHAEGARVRTSTASNQGVNPPAQHQSSQDSQQTLSRDSESTQVTDLSDKREVSFGGEKRGHTSTMSNSSVVSFADAQVADPDDKRPYQSKRDQAQSKVSHKKGKSTRAKSRKNDSKRSTAARKTVLVEYVQTLTLQTLVSGRPFELCVALLILFNAITIGVQTDWAIKNLDEEPPAAFRVIDIVFAFGFGLELLLRIIAEKKEFVSPKNANIRWNCFDSLLVVSSLVEEVLNTMDHGGAGPDMSAMQFLRIMRLVRVLRVIRMMRMFTDLRNMVHGILASLKSLMWCLVLLIMIMFTFAVCMMQVASEELKKSVKEVDAQGRRLIGEDYEGAHDDLITYFGSLFDTVFTLFMAISGGLDWSDAALPLMTIHPMMGFLFALYIAFAVFCVLNIVTGVFVENATKITQQHDSNAIMDELNLKEMWSDEIQHLFINADTDGSGELDWDEFEACLQEEKVQEYFQKLGVSMEPDCVYALFQLLDFDGDGAVDVDEFVEGCTHVQGNARSIDLVRLRHENKLLNRQIDDLRDMCEWYFNHPSSVQAAERSSVQSLPGQTGPLVPPPPHPDAALPKGWAPATMTGSFPLNQHDFSQPLPGMTASRQLPGMVFENESLSKLETWSDGESV